jgi:hypothetical protein
MATEPRGLFHFIEPKVRRELKKRVYRDYKKAMDHSFETFMAMRALSRSINLVVYGNEFGERYFEEEPKPKR